MGSLRVQVFFVNWDAALHDEERLVKNLHPERSNARSPVMFKVPCTNFPRPPGKLIWCLKTDKSKGTHLEHGTCVGLGTPFLVFSPPVQVPPDYPLC